MKVTDGRGSPVSGVAVEFETTAGGSFISVPGTMVYVGTDGALEGTASNIDSVNGDVYPATSTVPLRKKPLCSSKQIGVDWQKFTMRWAQAIQVQLRRLLPA